MVSPTAGSADAEVQAPQLRLAVPRARGVEAADHPVLTPTQRSQLTRPATHYAVAVVVVVDVRQLRSTPAPTAEAR
jgi:hypothetical protein